MSVRRIVLDRAERCQFEQSPIERPQLLRWSRAAVIAMRRIGHRRGGPAGLGAPSRFAVGEWVRVKDPEQVRATFDSPNKSRGLLFTEDQWSYCSNTYRVSKVVRRMLDDRDRMRTISRAVVLADVTCDGADGTQGCGRSCALLFKDEWLEPSSPPLSVAGKPPTMLVRLKSVDAIRATLGTDGRLDGMAPPPSFAELGGTLHGVVRTWSFSADHLSLLGRKPQAAWYILDGLRCDGTVLGDAGPCDRSCPLLWHESWLEVRSSPVL